MHEIDMTTGKAAMAYVGEKPWHGLGAQINPDADIAEWRVAAGLNWEIQSTPVLYAPDEGEAPRTSGLDRHVLFRSDTRSGLSVVSSYFKPVQPGEVLDFFSDLTKSAGFRMHTAGSLKGGRKIWALAEIGQDAMIGRDDKVEGYLLLATACDGTMATTARFTSVRVVCANTLAMATNTRAREGNEVKVYHLNTFDAQSVKAQLGIAAETWTSFIEAAKLIAKVKLDDAKAVQVLRKVFGTEETAVLDNSGFLDRSPTSRKVLELFQGKAIGSNLESAAGTAWGLLNACTEHFDHRSGSRTADARLDSAWFGKGAQTKQAVWDECVKLAA